MMMVVIMMMKEEQNHDQLCHCSTFIEDSHMSEFVWTTNWDNLGHGPNH